MIAEKGTKKVDISIEVTARDEAHVLHEVARIKAHLPQVNVINVPDILRFPVRSWKACRLIKPTYDQVIPHLRAIDFSPHRPFELANELDSTGIDRVLVISGDNNRTDLRPVYPIDSLTMIKKLRQEMPHITIYAGIDPYRQDFQGEYRYAMQKLEAGASGFFTQPFFDLRMMAIYAELLPNVPIYWGVSPVLSAKSVAYWETVNRAIFPKHFDPSMAWNRQFAQDALSFVRSQPQGNIYYMPIRADVIEYLEGIV